MENLKFEIVRYDLVPNQYGQNEIRIQQVKVVDGDGNYIKFAKLNVALLKALSESDLVTFKKKS